MSNLKTGDVVILNSTAKPHGSGEPKMTIEGVQNTVGMNQITAVWFNPTYETMERDKIVHGTDGAFQRATFHPDSLQLVEDGPEIEDEL